MEQTYAYVMSRLEDMKPRFDEGFNSSDRDFLENLHRRIFHKGITLTGCSDCYRDAYLILRNKLKKDKKMPKPTNYALKPGALIHFFGESEYYTGEVPDAVAERFIKQKEDNIKLFSRVPDDWKERISKPTTRKGGKKNTSDKASPEETPTEEAPVEENIENNTPKEEE